MLDKRQRDRIIVYLDDWGGIIRCCGVNSNPWPSTAFGEMFGGGTELPVEDEVMQRVFACMALMRQSDERCFDIAWQRHVRNRTYGQMHRFLDLSERRLRELLNRIYEQVAVYLNGCVDAREIALLRANVNAKKPVKADGARGRVAMAADFQSPGYERPRLALKK